MADFSHLSALKVQPDSIVGYDELGLRPTDEMFVEALNQIHPPLLATTDLRVVLTALMPRRGRPRKDAPSLLCVTRQLMKLTRRDVPTRFLELLAARLESGKRHTQFDIGLERLRERKKQERTTFVWVIYDEIKQLLDGGKFVAHPMLGRLEVPRGLSCRSEQALAMTQTFLRKIKRDPPSTRTMQNIITERNRRRFRESSAA